MVELGQLVRLAKDVFHTVVQERKGFNKPIWINSGEYVVIGEDPKSADSDVQAHMYGARKIKITGLPKGIVSRAVLKIGLTDDGNWEFTCLTDRNTVVLESFNRKDKGKPFTSKFALRVGSHYSDIRLSPMSDLDQVNMRVKFGVLNDPRKSFYFDAKGSSGDDKSTNMRSFVIVPGVPTPYK